MAFDLADLEKETKTKTAKYLDYETEFEYRPATLTPAFAKRISNAERDGEQEIMVDGVIDLVASWDITSKKKPLPLEAESVERLPLPLIGAIYQACFQDQGSDEDAKNESNSRSSRKVSRVK